MYLSREGAMHCSDKYRIGQNVILRLSKFVGLENSPLRSQGDLAPFNQERKSLLFTVNGYSYHTHPAFNPHFLFEL